MGRSFLNSQSFVLGMEEFPFCDICYVEESTSHYMLSCTFFIEQGKVLFKTVSEPIPNFMKFTMKRRRHTLKCIININLNILDCRNVPLTLAVKKYILVTNHLKKKTPNSAPTINPPSLLLLSFYFIATTESLCDNIVIHL